MQKTFQAPEMNNGNVGMGARQEEAIFNPRGPGRGGKVKNGQLSVSASILSLKLQHPNV